ncbi:PiggyBac transposable element-derived protein 1 [Trichinella britovi]|uniref:PiggyBac transposable element-derived protein 1 n=1 Tax=Trichinella britovi TaxID=45882 RepID=A0A0V1CFR2_TRIBR|nr:PiggyBac transposable element-derived protein 1 [Trichinella britovi]
MPKVENPVGFFSADVVVSCVKLFRSTRGTKDGIHSVSTMRINRLRGCPVMPFNELKRRGRGATDFYRTKDNKMCVLKWFDNREVIFVDPVEPVTRCDKRKLQFIEVPCSAVVSEYKKFIRGVDFTRMLISLYRMDRSVYRCKRDRRQIEQMDEEE